MKDLIHIGTSGWSYREWRGVFYPEKVKPAEYLGYYAGYFNTIEINSSYYHLPQRTTVKRWGETVHKDFRFCPKMNRRVTHYTKLSDPEQTLPDFFEAFEPINQQLGPVLIQLPGSLSFDEETVSVFYEALNKYRGYQFAIEPRHESWFVNESIQMMEENHISFVIADWGTSRKFPAFITGASVYVRFHGSLSYDASYPDGFLARYAQKIKEWETQGYPVWVFFNNTAKGYAVNNAKKLLSLLGLPDRNT